MARASILDLTLQEIWHTMLINLYQRDQLHTQREGIFRASEWRYNGKSVSQHQRMVITQRKFDKQLLCLDTHFTATWWGWVMSMSRTQLANELNNVRPVIKHKGQCINIVIDRITKIWITIRCTHRYLWIYLSNRAVAKDMSLAVAHQLYGCLIQRVTVICAKPEVATAPVSSA